MKYKDKIKHSLDQLSDSWDEEIMSQLHQARKTALDSQPNREKRKSIFKPLMAPALAAVLMIAMIVILKPADRYDSQMDSMFMDMEMLANDVDADLLEDMEFLTWLEEENALEGEVL